MSSHKNLNAVARRLSLLTPILLVAALLASPLSIFAQPQVPHRLWGTVTLAGASDARLDGKPVVVQVPGVTGSPTQPANPVVASGQYGISPNFLILGDDLGTTAKEGARAGDIVAILIDQAQVANVTYQVGGAQQLNLSVALNQLLAPTLATPASAPANTTLTASGTVLNAAGTGVSGVTVTFNWGDGSATSTVTSGAGGAYSGTHSYTTAGNYTITATATGTGYVRGLASASATVTTPVLVVTVSANPASTTTGTQVTASGAVTSSSVAIEGASVHIDWGDNTSSDTTSAANGSYSATHSYATTGTFQVEARATKTGFTQGQATTQVIVASSVTPALSVSISATPSPTFTNVTVTASGVVRDQAQAVVSGATVDVTWGEAPSSSVQSGADGSYSATHSYAAAGTYTIQATASKTGFTGSASSTQITITVPVLVVTVTPSPSSTTLNATMTASGTVTSSGAAIEGATVTVGWGDGTADAAATTDSNGAYSASHAYGAVGTYTITATAAKALYTTSSSVTTQVTITAPAGGGGGGGAPPPPPPPTPPPAPPPTEPPAPPPTTPPSTTPPEVIQTMPTTQAVQVIEQVSTARAAEVLQQVTSAKGAEIVQQLATSKAAEVLQQLTTAKATEIVQQLSASKAAEVVQQLTTAKAAEVVQQLTAARASEVMQQLTTAKAAEVIQQLTTAKAAEVLSSVSSAKASEVMQALTTTTLTQVVSAMSEASLTAALPGLSADKISSIPSATLFAALPNAPTVQLVGAVPPTPPPDLPAPTVILVTPTQERFLAVRTTANEWVIVAATPVPLTRILIKTKQALSNVENTVDILPGPPADLKTPPPGQKVAYYFTISLKNAAPEQVAAGYVEFRLEKAWFAANNIHKWSIALHRFDTKLNAWMPLEAKVIKEDDKLVHYSASLPAMSLFAITGGAASLTREYSVDKLTVTPASAPAGKPVQVSAVVTSKLNEERTLPITLWVNSTIEEVKMVKVPAKGTASVTFSLTKAKAGTYEVRVDRGIGRLNLTEPKGGPSVSPLIYGIGALVVVAAIVLFAILRRRKAVPAKS